MLIFPAGVVWDVIAASYLGSTMTVPLVLTIQIAHRPAIPFGRCVAYGMVKMVYIDDDICITRG